MTMSMRKLVLLICAALFSLSLTVQAADDTGEMKAEMKEEVKSEMQGEVKDEGMKDEEMKDEGAEKDDMKAPEEAK